LIQRQESRLKNETPNLRSRATAPAVGRCGRISRRPLQSPGVSGGGRRSRRHRNAPTLSLDMNDTYRGSRGFCAVPAQLSRAILATPGKVRDPQPAALPPAGERAGQRRLAVAGPGRAGWRGRSAVARGRRHLRATRLVYGLTNVLRPGGRKKSGAEAARTPDASRQPGLSVPRISVWSARDFSAALSRVLVRFAVSPRSVCRFSSTLNQPHSTRRNHSVGKIISRRYNLPLPIPASTCPHPMKGHLIARHFLSSRCCEAVYAHQ
jgi:hypothetical protein